MTYSLEIAALIQEHGYVEAFKIYQERKREREAIIGEGHTDPMPWADLKRKQEAKHAIEEPLPD